MDPNLDITVRAADLGLDRSNFYTLPIKTRAELEARIRELETQLAACKKSHDWVQEFAAALKPEGYHVEIGVSAYKTTADPLAGVQGALGHDVSSKLFSLLASVPAAPKTLTS